MGRRLMLLFICVLHLYYPSLVAGENTHDKEEYPKTSVIIWPRDEEAIPFSCHIQNGIFYISFERDLGLVDISISAVGGAIVANHTADSAVGDVEIVLPEQTGCYQITIITNEKIYTGNLYY